MSTTTHQLKHIANKGTILMACIFLTTISCSKPEDEVDLLFDDPTPYLHSQLTNTDSNGHYGISTDSILVKTGVLDPNKDLQTSLPVDSLKLAADSIDAADYDFNDPDYYRPSKKPHLITPLEAYVKSLGARLA